MQLRNLLFTLALSLTTLVAFSQTDVSTSAQSYVDAYVSQDFEKLFFLTHPNIISMGGGKEYVLEDIKRERTTLANLGFNFLEGNIGLPGEILNSNGELQTVVPVNYVIQIENDKYNSDAALFAASSDGGETWRFVNLDQYDRESLKTFIPSLNDGITLPARAGFTKIDK